MPTFKDLWESIRGNLGYFMLWAPFVIISGVLAWDIHQIAKSLTKK